MSFPLHAQTYRIGSRCYRKTAYCAGAAFKSLADVGDTPDLYADEDDDGPSCANQTTGQLRDPVLEAESGYMDHETAEEPVDKVCEEDPRVFQRGKKFMAFIDVPSSLIGKLIGIRGGTRRNIEEATNCRLILPRKGQKGPVEISSFSSAESVQRCLDRIEMVVDEAKKSARFTHFVAIPCNSDDIKNSYELFKQVVLSTEGFPSSVKDENLFTPVNKLHLTLSMLWMFDESDYEKAQKILNFRQLLGDKPLEMDIQGLSIMNDDPSDVHVLYGNAKHDKLQEVADKISNAFSASGLAPTTTSDVSTTETAVKLHMTLMNSRYQSQANDSRKRKSFDVTAILEEYGDYYFGTIPLTKVSVCALHSVESGSFYKETHIMEL